MGKRSCHNCGARIADDYDYCPHCGVRLQREESRRGGGVTGCLVVFFIIVILSAIGGTVWLVREHDRQEVEAAREKYTADSLKALRIAAERLALQQADSQRMVRDSIAEAQRLESLLCRASDVVTDGRLRAADDILDDLRARGYQTIGRQQSTRMTVVGLNAEMHGDKISGRGAVYSAVAVWPDRVEAMFSDEGYADEFVRSLQSGRRLAVSRRANGVVEIRRVEISD